MPAKSPAQKKDTQATRANFSSGKLLTLIEIMSTMEQPARLQELAQALDMPPSTVHRFLATLQNRGYVAQNDDDGRYFLTFKLCGVADNIQRHQTVLRTSQPFLRQVADSFGESANLCAESNSAVMYLEVVQGKQKTLCSMHYIGHAAPMHCTGAGKLLMTGFSEKQVERYIRDKGLPRLTANTITNKEALLRELQAITAQGYAYDNEECEMGVRCIAAPVYDYRGRIVACVSVSGPTLRMTDKHIKEHLPELLETARLFSQRLGWTAAE